MKIRVADYIAKFLVEHNCNQVFSVVGGGAMYLNDAFGNAEGLKCLYTHHEQAAALAAEGYARMKGTSACVCVTTGPGGTNALTGVLCAYQDNIPMLVVSGQVRYATTVASTGLNLRQFGEQEYNIVPTVKPMTKYAVMVERPEDIRYHLEKAYKLANSGRRGPCWIDVPLDVQGAIIDTETLHGYEETEEKRAIPNMDAVLRMLSTAKQPVIVVGSGLRTSGALEEFKNLAKMWNVPVLSATSIVDYYTLEDENYFGMFGVFGSRAGNFIVQNADVILSLGCRLAFKHIGFNYENFSPNSKKIVVDVDVNELQKNTMNIDLPICADLKDFLGEERLHNSIFTAMDERWPEYCNYLKKKFPVYEEKFETSEKVNPYTLANEMKQGAKEDQIIVVGNSVACVSVLQSGIGKEGQRLFGNANCGTMGYDIPAAVGAAVAAEDEVFCITGDGSMQMNIQELQTIVHNNLPVKLIIFNNGGYQAIVQTQTNFFGRLSGCNKESGVSMPDIKKIAEAYGFPYIRIEKNAGVKEGIQKLRDMNGFAICELIQDDSQGIEPRTKSMEKEDGTIFSPPIDHLFPFLTEEEYEKCQFEAFKRG